MNGEPVGREIPAFTGFAEADPDQELNGTGVALARAIAAAAMAAAEHIGEPEKFEVSRIQITVAPNPGPTSCKVIITPTGDI